MTRSPLAQKSLPAAKIRELDNRAKALGLEEQVLIENASSNLFRVIDKLNLGKKVLVIAGRGNNGADVLSCARKLISHSYDVKVAILEEKQLGDQAQRQKDILENIGLSLHSIEQDNLDILNDLFKDRDFIVEGILGIGVKGELAPLFKGIISAINNSGKKIVSCDIPSGLDPDKGVVLPEAIRADYTVTFIAPKQGFFLNQGKDHCGKIFLVDIGISREILEKGGG